MPTILNLKTLLHLLILSATATPSAVFAQQADTLKKSDDHVSKAMSSPYSSQIKVDPPRRNLARAINAAPPGAAPSEPAPLEDTYTATSQNGGRTMIRVPSGRAGPLKKEGYGCTDCTR